MSLSSIKESIYDSRVKASLKGLAEGRSREDLAHEFGLSSWKSLDIYMRRKGFTWDNTNGTYIPIITSVDKVMQDVISSVPVKAEQIVKSFEQDDADPRTIAKEMGFDSHREMAEYMERKGLHWDSAKENYFGDCASLNVLPEQIPNVVLDSEQPFIVPNKAEGLSEDLNLYLPLLRTLQQNWDRVMELLMPTADGHIPKYAVPGGPKTKSIYMSDLLSRIVTEFSESKNLSQREIVEAALIEYLKRYGYKNEMSKLLNKR